MNLTLKHLKNPAAGWDITAAATADKGEKISRAEIFVNDFSQYDKSFNPPINQWQQQLSQQGQYPGDNSSQLRITNDNGEVAESDDSWN